MYIKSKKDPREEWVQMKYKITKKTSNWSCRIGNQTGRYQQKGMQQQGGNTKATQHIDVEMNPPGNGTEDIDQGNGMEDAPEIGPTDQPPQPLPQTGRK
jgi:hypothetical protein